MIQLFGLEKQVALLFIGMSSLEATYPKWKSPKKKLSPLHQLQVPGRCHRFHLGLRGMGGIDKTSWDLRNSWSSLRTGWTQPFYLVFICRNQRDFKKWFTSWIAFLKDATQQKKTVATTLGDFEQVKNLTKSLPHDFCWTSPHAARLGALTYDFVECDLISIWL